jgi:hypothetical protein
VAGGWKGHRPAGAHSRVTTLVEMWVKNHLVVHPARTRRDLPAGPDDGDVFGFPGLTRHVQDDLPVGAQGIWRFDLGGEINVGPAKPVQKFLTLARSIHPVVCVSDSCQTCR